MPEAVLEHAFEDDTLADIGLGAYAVLQAPRPVAVVDIPIKKSNNLLSGKILFWQPDLALRVDR